MSTAPKRTSRRAPRFYTSEEFSTFGCEEITYIFRVTRKQFDLKRLFHTIGIEASAESWSGLLNPKNATSGYHVHFDGSVEVSDSIELQLRYYSGSSRPRKGDTEPFAESIMAWIGEFFNESSCRASVSVRFMKSTDHWRSRFTLPFTIPMSDTEVTIDGVSMNLPANTFGASACWLRRVRAELMVGMLFLRRVEFSTFDIFHELSEFNESTKLVIEEAKS